MAALPDLITVEQYRQLPKGGEFVYELHDGEVVEVTRPSEGHWDLQVHLVDLLRTKLASFGKVGMEFPYRAIPEFDLRAAEVAVVSWPRKRATNRGDNLRGAPELVIEVISPSNTKRKLRELVSLCLNNGAIECWLVDPNKESVTVMRTDGSSALYERGAEVPLTAFGSDSLPVTSIFELDD
jgi:Uma2 family endonuclease